MLLFIRVPNYLADGTQTTQSVFFSQLKSKLSQGHLLCAVLLLQYRTLEIPVFFFSNKENHCTVLQLILKVSKSRKQIMKSWILPKNERNTLRIISCVIEFRQIFRRVKDIIICFRDLLTFTKMFIGCSLVINCWHGGFKWVPKSDFKVNVHAMST